MTLRPASFDDCAALARLHATGFDRPWEAEDFETLLLDSADGLVIEDNGRILSCLFARLVIDEAEIVTFVTDPEFSRQGLARRLIKTLTEDYRRRGVVKLFLEVREDNLAAQQLYQSQGFEIMGQRRDYYAGSDGTRRDAITMLKFL